MHAGAVPVVAGFECAPVGVDPPVLRQQRGVQVDHFPPESIEHRFADDAHEPGQHDQVRFTCRHQQGQGRIEVTALGETAVFEHAAADPGVGCALQARCVGHVADDMVDANIQPPGVYRVNDRLQVAAGAGDQDGHVADRAQDAYSTRSALSAATTTSPMS